MTSLHEIHADYDRETLVVYQAYSDAIADPALGAGTFVEPFSFGRMTWIKPSFAWLMHRSNWGTKKGQNRTLRVRIRRSGWDRALRIGVLTSPDGPVFSDRDRWERAFDDALVHVQWDPERSLRGAALHHYSIQVGLSRDIIREFVDEWIVELEDFSSAVAKLRSLLRSGEFKKAQRLLPRTKLYAPPEESIDRIFFGHR